jgi:TetR/AcrR family transcriptional regulator, regulator of cefoperazone and chloramphenicol sensitivity
MNQPREIRERLIEAARELFARDGFDAASVRDIAALAHANLGAITYHFGSKEALYHTVIERFATPLADRLAAISAEPGPPLERLATAMWTFMDHVWQHPEMPPLILRELASDRPLAEPVAVVIRRNMESFSRMVSEGQADGSIRAGEPHLMAMSVVGQPIFLAIASRAIRQAIGTDPGDPAIRSLIAEHVIMNMKAALSNAPPAARAATRAGVENPAQDRTP